MSWNCGYQRAYCSSPKFCMSMESHGGIILTGKSCPNVTSTTNITWTDPGTNLDLHGERPATNRLSHGMALLLEYSACRIAREPWWTNKSFFPVNIIPPCFYDLMAWGMNNSFVFVCSSEK
jgi:hypothetical protein